MPTGTCSGSISLSTSFSGYKIANNQCTQHLRTNVEKEIREVFLRNLPSVDPSLSVSFSFTPDPPPLVPVMMTQEQAAAFDAKTSTVVTTV